MSYVEDPFVTHINSKVNLSTVFKEYFSIYVPDLGDMRTSWKTRCPLGYAHADGGLDKNFRVYPSSNRAYCFEMHGTLTPCRLMSLHWGISQKNAAKRLANEYGLGKQHWRKRLPDVLINLYSEQAIGDKAAIRQALSIYVDSLNLSPDKKYASKYLQLMPKIYASLDSLYESDPDEETIKKWLVKAKQILYTATLE